MPKDNRIANSKLGPPRIKQEQLHCSPWNSSRLTIRGRLALLEKLVLMRARWLGIRRSTVVYWQALSINQQSQIQLLERRKLNLRMRYREKH